MRFRRIDKQNQNEFARKKKRRENTIKKKKKSIKVKVSKQNT